MKRNFRFYFVLLLILGFNTYHVSSQESGESIFKANCTACHTMGSQRLVGPGLEGVTSKHSKEWLKKWINNSAEMIASGDEAAVAIYEEYNKQAMQAFYFSDEEFESLYAYLKDPPKEEKLATVTSESTVNGSDTNQSFALPLLVFLIVLSYVLFSLKTRLQTSLGQNPKSIFQILKYEYDRFMAVNTNIFILGFTIFIIIANVAYSAMMSIGVTTNYMPDQPIAFSHKLHAGDNQIDCNYCHSSARHSKHSGIPSANVCMNCHENIVTGQTESGTAEIQKIYDAVGYDPDKRQYIEGYVQKPIEWIRIHNLADHAYFNHSQHVVAGQLECQECHGPVEEMEVLYQYSELTMGWCVECHRDEEVKMEGNNYYTHLHEQLKEKYGNESFSVAEVGGLECAKCHY